MAKITYGANGNAKKKREAAEAKKKREKERAAKKAESEAWKKENNWKPTPKKTKIIDSIDSNSMVDEIIQYEIPEELRNRIESSEEALYDNDYIRQSLKERITAADELDMDDMMLKSMQDELHQRPFTDWDVRIDDEIEYFDPDLSYELTGYRPITETQGLDFDPDWFRQDAIVKEQTGKYSEYEINGPAYVEFWKERFRRCRYGYTYNGYTVTGPNYFYLNYYRMQSPIVLKAGSKAKKSERRESFPTFLAEQYKYFHYVEMCKKLGLDVLALKSRGINPVPFIW